MTPERYRQIGELFHAALELNPAERAAFIDQACAGDEKLRREVESLIESANRTTDFIDKLALAAAAELVVQDKSDSLIGQTATVNKF